MRFCHGCKTEHPLENFYTTPGGRCRECVKVQRNEYYVRSKRKRVTAWLTKLYANTPCLDCSVVFPYCAMDFHHRPEESKSFSIGSRGTRMATPKHKRVILKEIAKCDYICACCHRIRTKGSRDDAV